MTEMAARSPAAVLLLLYKKALSVLTGLLIYVFINNFQFTFFSESILKVLSIAEGFSARASLQFLSASRDKAFWWGKKKMTNFYSSCPFTAAAGSAYHDKLRKLFWSKY